VAIFPDTATINGVNEINENTPGLFDVGFVNANDTSENDLFGIVKFDRVGVAIFTVKSAVMDADKNPASTPRVAVIVVLPDFRIVTSRPDMVATSVLLLVNVNIPPLGEDVGSVKLNGTVPYTRGATTKLVNTGVVIVAAVAATDYLYITKRL
jgi:hypothetical protein